MIYFWWWFWIYMFINLCIACTVSDEDVRGTVIFTAIWPVALVLLPFGVLFSKIEEHHNKQIADVRNYFQITSTLSDYKDRLAGYETSRLKKGLKYSRSKNINISAEFIIAIRDELMARAAEKELLK